MTVDDVITALENENAKLMNRIFDLEAEKEALISGQETLQKALAEKNAEIKKQNILLKDAYETAEAVSANWEVGKSKEIKKFAEEFEKRCIKSGVYPAVTKNILKNLVKELTEVSNGE
jgi:uncharacterized protein YdcH (DUF465 family)